MVALPIATPLPFVAFVLEPKAIELSPLASVKSVESVALLLLPAPIAMARLPDALEARPTATPFMPVTVALAPTAVPPQLVPTVVTDAP